MQIVIYKHNLFAYPRSFRQTVNVCYTSLFTMAEQYRNPIEKIVERGKNRYPYHTNA
jgi:hypothetical protein